MLDVLRSNAKSTFTWIIVIGIVVMFAISFGPGSFTKTSQRESGMPYAAKVNGKVIPAAAWERRYRQLFAMAQQQLGDAFTRELADQLGLSRQAMEDLVGHELVVQEARRRGIVVTPQELTRVVQAMPSFQENGRYKHELYADWARETYGSEGRFEAQLKEDLLYQKMVTAVRETVKIPEAEVRTAWEADADKVGLVFVRFPLAAAEAEAGKPTDADAKAFAEKDADRVKKFYDDNRARYDQMKKVRVRHVLARVGAGQDDAAARKKIDEAKGRLAKGEDFAKVAAALSDDANTKARGGELGFVSEGLFDEAFVKAAFALSPGQVSEPVRAGAGFHVIQAEEVVPAKQVSLDDARLDIAKELLRKDRARKLADAKAQAALDAARKGKALGALFPEKSPVKLGGQPIVAEDTGAFGREAALAPKLGQAPEVIAAAFAARKGDVLPRVYEAPAGPVVAAVTLREQPDAAKFATEREATETRLRNRKESAVLGAWLRAIRTASKVEENRELLAASASAE